MKIIFVNLKLDPIWGGGTAERTRRLALTLAKQGHLVSILTTTIGFDEQERAKYAAGGVTVHALDCISGHFAVPLFQPGKLADMIAEHDVIHLSSHWTSLNAVVFLLARWKKVPYVVNPAGALPVMGRSKFLKMIFNQLIGYALIRNAAAHIAVTAAEFEQFSAYGVQPDAISVIPNGVMESAFDTADTAAFRAKFRLGDHPFILFVGRLNWIKGPDLLLDAFAQIAHRFPAYHLVFAGPNEGMEQELQDRLIAYKLSGRVKFLGYVGGSDKIAAYRAATLLAIPSRKEAMSIVVLEAGAAGTPVILTDQCGFDVIERFGGGKIVQADAQHIAEGLLSMLSAPQELAVAGERLRNLVRREYTWDVAAYKLADVFSKIVKHKVE